MKTIFDVVNNLDNAAKIPALRVLIPLNSGLAWSSKVEKTLA